MGTNDKIRDLVTKALDIKDLGWDKNVSVCVSIHRVDIDDFPTGFAEDWKIMIMEPEKGKRKIYAEYKKDNLSLTLFSHDFTPR